MPKTILFLSFVLFTGKSYPQADQKSLVLRGYLTNMQSVLMEAFGQDWKSENLFHNRLNFYWYPSDHLTANLQIRNRFIYGDLLESTPGYAKQVGADNGVADLSFNLSSGQSYLLNSTIDRAWLRYTRGNLVITGGRQRINWGQSFVWNPNDIFNVYSFFDFDYVERPGSDAFRVQYYTGMASLAELAFKIDSGKRVTTAGMYRLNVLGYDVQVLGGLLNSEDYLVGMGWSGNIGDAGFRGEASFFRPVEHFADTSGLFYLSLSADYTFASSLSLQAEGLYAEKPQRHEAENFMEYYRGPLSVKDLSITEFSLFSQASYQITPLLRTGMALMVFPGISGYYAGPSCSYSLTQNIDLSCHLQIFSGRFQNALTGREERMNFNLGFLRFKWNF